MLITAKLHCLLCFSLLEGTLMQIWKSSYITVFKQKQYPQNFAVLILRILEWSLRVKFVNFMKSRLIFNIFYCFWMFVNKHFTYLTRIHISKSKRCYIVQSSAYFPRVKMKLPGDFHICISAPLTVILASIFLYLFDSILIDTWPIFNNFAGSLAIFFRAMHQLLNHACRQPDNTLSY